MKVRCIDAKNDSFAFLQEGRVYEAESDDYVYIVEDMYRYDKTRFVLEDQVVDPNHDIAFAYRVQTYASNATACFIFSRVLGWKFVVSKYEIIEAMNAQASDEEAVAITFKDNILTVYI